MWEREEGEFRQPSRIGEIVNGAGWRFNILREKERKAGGGRQSKSVTAKPSSIRNPILAARKKHLLGRTDAEPKREEPRRKTGSSGYNSAGKSSTDKRSTGKKRGG